MSRNNIEAVNEFYDDWNSADIVRKRQLLFARLKRLNRPISVTEITEDIYDKIKHLQTLHQISSVL